MFHQGFSVAVFSLKHDIFIISKLFHNADQVRCYHFFIVEVTVESVNLIGSLGYPAPGPDIRLS